MVSAAAQLSRIVPTPLQVANSAASPERHGAMGGIIKDRLDASQFRCGAADARQDACGHAGERGSPSFNAVNQLRVLGRWMRMKHYAVDFLDRLVFAPEHLGQVLMR